MAKTSGFAALAAIQDKVIKAEPADLESTIASKSQVDATGEDLGDVTDSQSTNQAPPATAPTTEPEEETPILLNDTPIQEWTTEQLESYIKGETDEPVYLVKLKEAVAEHRIRENVLSAAWTLEQCKEFLAQGIVPAKTSKGAWVEDVTRQYRREYEWETNELESWALGEIKAEGATLDAGLAIELKKRLNLNVPSVDVNAVITNYKHATGQAKAAVVETRPAPASVAVTEAQVASVTEQITYAGLTTVNQSYLENSLAKYAAVMQVGRTLVPSVGGEAQKLLMEVINYAIQLPDATASKSAMALIFNFIKANRAPGKIFEDTYVYRNIEDMKATVASQKNFAHLLTLFVTFADDMVELRAQTDIPSLIKGVPSQFQSRVLEFFSRV